MAKAKTVYSCTECGGQSPKWQGQCPQCEAWNTLVETIAAPVQKRFQTVAGKIEPGAPARQRRGAPHATLSDRRRGVRSRAGRRARPGRRDPAGRRSGHRQVDAAAAGDGGDRRREEGALHHRRGIGRAGRAARAAARPRQRAGVAAGRSPARGHRRRDLGRAARGRRHRFDPDGVHRGADLGAGKRRAGPRMRGAADEARQAARHRRRVRRPRDEGRRDRRPARAGAHRRYGALLRGRSAFELPAGARDQEPLRRRQRARRVRDDRAGARRAWPIRPRCFFRSMERRSRAR